MEQYIVDFKSIPWEAQGAGVKCKAYKQGRRWLRLVEFTKEFVEPNWCTKGHIGYVLEGQMEINFDGKKVVFGPGDGLFIPAGEQHQHKARILTNLVKVILMEDS
jgi:quercetin dioxygenase-like cupin family protein